MKQLNTSDATSLLATVATIAEQLDAVETTHNATKVDGPWSTDELDPYVQDAIKALDRLHQALAARAQSDLPLETLLAGTSAIPTRFEVRS